MCDNHASYCDEIDWVSGDLFEGYLSEMILMVTKYMLTKFGALVRMCMIIQENTTISVTVFPVKRIKKKQSQKSLT